MSTPELSPPGGITVMQVVLASIILGVVAGTAVWWLKRFEMNDFYTRMQNYLERHDEFRQWDADHPRPPAPDVQS